MPAPEFVRYSRITRDMRTKGVLHMHIAKVDLIEGLAKGLAVLEAFDTERQRLNSTLTAQRAGITRAAARRHLLTLAHLGYLESADGWYWLAPKVLRFSGTYLASARVPRAVQPVLDQLAAQKQEAFSAAVLDGDVAVIVARSGNEGQASPGGGRRMLAHGLHLGARLPAHATSTGHVLLAGLPRQAFATWLKEQQLRRLTPQTITNPSALRAVVSQVRKQDFCIAYEEHESGVAALAVPVRDARGEVVAAINVVVSPQRFDPDALHRAFFLPLRDAASQLRSLL
ncbi:MAG TPA: IclR family transcriptional regulator C-terminal domain-containing protein [Pseudoxanthomonas sp.]|jgi:IclR family pca regulon transcriptional regulator